MKKGPEMFVALCDALIADPSYTHACRAVGINFSTLTRWLAACAQNPAEFTFEYGDYGTMTLSDAVKLATKLSMGAMGSEVMSRARGGTRKKKWFQGMPVWEHRTDIPPDMPPDEIELCFGQRDHFLRDTHGNLIQAVEVEYSDNLQLSVLAKKGDASWRDQKHIQVGGNVGVGVTVIQPRQIPAPVSQKIVQEIVQEEVREIAAQPVQPPPVNEPPDDADEPSAEMLPPDLLPDAEDTPRPAPYVPNAEPPEADEPPEMVTVPKGKPVPVDEGEAERIAAIRKRLLAQAAVPVKNPRPTAGARVDTGTSLLTDTRPSREG